MLTYGYAWIMCILLPLAFAVWFTLNAKKHGKNVVIAALIGLSIAGVASIFFAIIGPKDPAIVALQHCDDMQTDPYGRWECRKQVFAEYRAGALTPP